MERPGLINRATLVVTGIVGLLVGLTTLGEKVGSFADSKIFAFLYVGSDLFVIEATLLFLAFLFRRPLWARLRQAVLAVPELWRGGRMEVVVLVLSIVALAAAGVLAARQAAYYTIGKRLAIKRHSGILAERAARDFLNGDELQARRVAGICIDIFDSEQCKQLVASLDRRKRFADVFTQVYANTWPSTWSRSSLALAIYLQDRNWEKYDRRMRAESERLERMRAAYQSATARAAGGETAAALSEFRAIAEEMDFGQASRIVQELENTLKGSSRGVMLRALQDYGAETFVKELTSHHRIVRLTKPHLGGEVETREAFERRGSHYVNVAKYSSDTELEAIIAKLKNGWR
jgi:hypothetical protein